MRIDQEAISRLVLSVIPVFDFGASVEVANGVKRDLLRTGRRRTGFRYDQQDRLHNY